MRNNKKVDNYECLLIGILYCPGNGQELLSTLGVTLVCHASNGFLLLKVNNRLVLKSNGVVVGPGVISNCRTFGSSFGVSLMFLFSGIESSAGFPNTTPRTICTGNFIEPEKH